MSIILSRTLSSQKNNKCDDYTFSLTINYAKQTKLKPFLPTQSENTFSNELEKFNPG